MQKKIYTEAYVSYYINLQVATSHRAWMYYYYRIPREAVNELKNYVVQTRPGQRKIIRQIKACKIRRRQPVKQSSNQSNMGNVASPSAALIAPTFSPAHYLREAPIVSEHGVQAELMRKGFCRYHSDIQLRKKKRFGGWKTVKASCPECDQERRNNQGASTTSISSPIATILSKMQMNEYIHHYTIHESNKYGVDRGIVYMIHTYHLLIFININ